MFKLFKKLFISIISFVKNLIFSLFYLKKIEGKIISLLLKAKQFVIFLNNKILSITDKIVIFYERNIEGKPSKCWNWIKSKIKKIFVLLKSFCLFVIEFYKKDKKRAIIYFILLYFIYKAVIFCAHKTTILFKHNKNDIVVSVREVKAERVNKEVNCYGYLESENNLQYLSEVRGNVDKIFVQEKQHVKEGQLLMILDSKFTVNSYTSAKSILASKEMQYNAVKKLYESGLESKSNLSATQADLESARSNFESAQKAYNGLKIYAQFDGYIDNITLKEGSQINPGSKLFTLERMNAMQVKCEVNNLSKNEVDVNDDVKVYVGGQEIGKGKISVVGDSVDVYTGNRSILVRQVEGLTGFEEKVKPGISVMMKITAKSNEDTFKISSEALETTKTGGFMVKVLNPEDDSISFKNVWMYDEQDGINYVSGLADGDLVVERGHEFVHIGEKDIQYSKIIENDSNESLLSKIKEKVVYFKDVVIDFFKNDFSNWCKNILSKVKSKIDNIKK